MGNRRNEQNRHICDGRFKKKRPPTTRGTKEDTTVTSTITPLNSSRIINLEELRKHIADISVHAATCQSCIDKAYTQGEAIMLVGEQFRDGLASVLTAQCKGCGTEIAFPTSSKVNCKGARQRWECNLAAVWGQMATGGSFSPLQESMSILGVPVMTKNSFMATERDLGKCWWEVLEDSMKSAGQEERRLAIERGDYHQGIPAITVITDGGWSKRTHKHSYNAKSGVAIIIGKETGKLLYIGVRNKYCAVCARAEKSGEIPSKHECFKNWSASSSSMETDILLEGFRQAEQQHGVRYIRFVGDGDSSVYPALIAGIPTWGYAIKKVECANHATKCYRAALEKLAQDNPSYRGKGKLTESMRKRLTKAARCAIRMRSSEPDRRRAVQLLQQDLRNGPLHCFGIHSSCSTDFCKVAQKQPTKQDASSPQMLTSPLSSDTMHLGCHPQYVSSSSEEVSSQHEQLSVDPTALNTLIQEQEQAWQDAVDDTNLDAVRSSAGSDCTIDQRLLCDIQQAVARLIAKAEHLLGNFTTNLAENWMHIRSKFDGGKQINRIQSGSWQNRCAGAGLRQNHGPSWGLSTWEKITAKTPNDIFTAVSQDREKQVQKDRERKATEKSKESRRQSKMKATDNSLQSRRDYSRYDGVQYADDIATDVPPDYLQDMMIKYYQTHIVVSQSQTSEIEYLTRQQGADDNSSNIWLAERRKRITSSNVGRIAKQRKSTNVANTVKQLLYSNFRGTAATRWGTFQEPMARSLYQERQRSQSPNLTITSSGLVIDPVNPWLAASPDNLVNDPSVDKPNGIVEYKNPYSVRDMSLIEAAEQTKDFCLKKGQDGRLTLNHSHPYYYQIQATMFCTKRTWCDFVVRTNKDLHIERVSYRDEFWKVVLPKLRSFYFDAILPELAAPHYQQGGIREPSDWIPSPDIWHDRVSKL